MTDAFGATHPGRVRTINEDRFLLDQDLQLFVVADGMGGHSAGDQAAEIATETIRAFVARSRARAEFTWPYGIDRRLSFDANRLSTALMGTTVVAALVQDDRICYGGVGDSRFYVCSGGLLAQVTEDDSWVATVLAADSTATREGMAAHPMRHVLTQALGATETIDVDIAERRLCAGDRFLLCSDGLCDGVDDAAIGHILSSASSAGDAVDRLMQSALRGPAVDNVTALVVEYSR